MTPRQLFTNAALFTLVAGVLDQGGGWVLDRLYARTRVGEGSGAVNHALEHHQAEVLMFGSSRAKQQLDPQIVERTTGWTAYNLGANGQGLPYARGVQALMIEAGASSRCHVLHLDVVDLVDPKLERMTTLAPFVARSEAVLELVSRGDRWARLKSWSALWRHNSVVLGVLRNQGKRPPADYRGYQPMKTRRQGFADAREFAGTAGAHEAITWNPASQQLLREFAAAARESGATPVWITAPMNPGGDASPTLDPSRVSAKVALGELAAELGVTYRSYDEVAHAQYRDPGLFVDPVHLHADGAVLLSTDVAADLRVDCGG